MTDLKARIAEAILDDPFIDDAYLTGTSQQGHRAEHYAQVCLDAMPKVELEWALSEEQYDGVRDLIRHAYLQGCTDVHNNYQPDPDPEFDEASYDYTSSVTQGFLDLFPSVSLSAAPKGGWG